MFKTIHTLTFMLILVFGFNVQASVVTLGDFTGVASMTQTDTGAELFHLTDTSGTDDDAAVFLMNLSSIGTTGDIGIYDKTSGTKLSVFSPGDLAITSTTLEWDISNNKVINSVTGDSAFIDYLSFGFYNNNWFSESNLNFKGRDHLSVFNTYGSGEPTLFGAHTELVWYNKLSTGVRKGKYDMVGATDIRPNNVPEPNLLALLSLGILGLGYVRKISA